MKLPRWLVIAMLTTSMLSVLAAAGWWWVTWPERTARKFFVLLREGNLEQANRMLSPRDTQTRDTDEQNKELVRSYLEEAHIDGSHQTALDLILCRRSFSFFEGGKPLPGGFEVERGKVLRRIE